MSCTIYDKTREMKQSGKEWFTDIWRLHGWDEEKDGSVWRVEFKFKREALHELQQDDEFWGIEDAFDLPERLPLLWAYAAGHVQGSESDERRMAGCVALCRKATRTARAGRRIRPGRSCKARFAKRRRCLKRWESWFASGMSNTIFKKELRRSSAMPHPSRRG